MDATLIIGVLWIIGAMFCWGSLFANARMEAAMLQHEHQRRFRVSRGTHVRVVAYSAFFWPGVVGMLCNDHLNVMRTVEKLLRYGISNHPMIDVPEAGESPGPNEGTKERGNEETEAI